MAKQLTTSWVALVALLLGLALAGCREEEQGRTVFFEPGKYRGVSDESLDTATVQALEKRTGNPQL